MSCPMANNGIAFIKNVITGDQCLASFKAGVFKIKGLEMMNITAIHKGKKGGGVHEYHLEDRP
jgi:hypothetical protein